MRMRASVRRRPGDRPQFSDRQDTRRHLLETAGEVLAERGLDAATGQEICRRAGVNSAAVNYYFGGVDGLYEAVLVEARGRIPSFEALSAAVAEEPDARAKLRAAVGLLVSVLTGPPAESWMVRVLLREVLSPSRAFDRLLEADGRRKLSVLRSIISEIMELPEDHPAVTQGCISFAAPFQVMIIGGRGVLDRVFPGIDLSTTGAPLLVERMTAFALGGLDAIARVEMMRSGKRSDG
jgi:TetR/AcrR family transcriptional regulator, regulator of cefoperazone and chloramphenicol sensitivity